MTDKILPCPFCGDPFEIVILDDDRAAYRHDNSDCPMHRNDLTGWVYETPEKLIAELNQRATTTGKFQDKLHELTDMAERLNALVMRHYPQAWGKDLVKATQEYIGELLRRHRADNDVFYRLVTEGKIMGLSLVDVQEMRKNRFDEIVKEGEERE
jgi:hypothetical protein